MSPVSALDRRSEAGLWLALGAAMLLAYLWRLGSYPGLAAEYEGQMAEAVRRLAHEGWTLWDDRSSLPNRWPTLLHTQIAWLTLAFGENPTTLRLLPALYGAAGVLLSGLLLRRLAGPGPALLAMGLLACNGLHWSLSRRLYTYAPLLLVQAAALLALWKAHEKPATWRLVWAGALCALPCYFYPAGRIAPAMGLAWLWALGELRWQRSRYYLLGLALGLAPLGLYELAHPGSLFAWIPGYVPDAPEGWRRGLHMLGRYAHHLAAFGFIGDPHPLDGQKGLPLLDPISLGLALLGLGLALRSWREAWSRVLLATLLLGVAPVLSTGTFVSPTPRRMALALLPAYAFAALGARQVWAWMQARAGRQALALGLAVGTLALAGAAWRTAAAAQRYTQDPMALMTNRQDLTVLAGTAAKLGGETFFAPGFVDESSGQSAFLFAGQAPPRLLASAEQILLPTGPQARQIGLPLWMLCAWPTVRERWPQAQLDHEPWTPAQMQVLNREAKIWGYPDWHLGQRLILRLPPHSAPRPVREPQGWVQYLEYDSPQGPQRVILGRTLFSGGHALLSPPEILGPSAPAKVRWRQAASLTPPRAGAYRFHLVAGKGRVFVGGRLVFDNVEGPAAPLTLQLRAQPVPVRVEPSFKNHGAWYRRFALAVEAPDGSFEGIPASWVRPDAP